MSTALALLMSRHDGLSTDGKTGSFENSTPHFDTSPINSHGKGRLSRRRFEIDHDVRPDSSSLTIVDVVDPRDSSGKMLMKGVRCHCDDKTVTLSGEVARFHHLQLAISAARSMADGRRIVLQMRVNSDAS